MPVAWRGRNVSLHLERPSPANAQVSSLHFLARAGGARGQALAPQLGLHGDTLRLHLVGAFPRAKLPLATLAEHEHGHVLHGLTSVLGLEFPAHAQAVEVLGNLLPRGDLVGLRVEEGDVVDLEPGVAPLGVKLVPQLVDLAVVVALQLLDGRRHLLEALPELHVELALLPPHLCPLLQGRRKVVRFQLLAQVDGAAVGNRRRQVLEQAGEGVYALALHRYPDREIQTQLLALRVHEDGGLLQRRWAGSCCPWGHRSGSS
mmetsp:Transcript_99986/g.308561  ORF Transcript_99986/g.308561 Transcript_99986/m.308561 type:complete len:260 (+) Transcript_99986:1414-2193(+)